MREAEAELDRDQPAVDTGEVNGDGVSGLNININVENGVSVDADVVPLFLVSRSDDGWRVHRAVLGRNERIQREVSARFKIQDKLEKEITLRLEAEKKLAEAKADTT